jgi:hypothetical protein
MFEFVDKFLDQLLDESLIELFIVQSILSLMQYGITPPWKLHETSVHRACHLDIVCTLPRIFFVRARLYTGLHFLPVSCSIELCRPGLCT